MDDETKPIPAAKQPQVVKLEAGSYAWCSCGRSAKQPYCDGSHKGTGLHPVKFSVESDKDVALCMCKLTGNPPFCDGSHTRV